MQDLKREQLDPLERAMLKMSEPERLKAVLLYEAFVNYGESGLEIAEDLLDEQSTNHPEFNEELFQRKFRERLSRSKSETL